MSSALKASLTEAMKTAMRSREKERLLVIRAALAAIKQIEVDERIEPDDDRVLAVLDKMVKQRRESIRQFLGGGREELAQQEQFEIGILQEFLPQPLSMEEVDKLIGEAIELTGASSMADMGKVMGWLKPRLQGRADMGPVSGKVKAALS